MVNSSPSQTLADGAERDRDQIEHRERVPRYPLPSPQHRRGRAAWAEPWRAGGEARRPGRGSQPGIATTGRPAGAVDLRRGVYLEEPCRRLQPIMATLFIKIALTKPDYAGYSPVSALLWTPVVPSADDRGTEHAPGRPRWARQHLSVESPLSSPIGSGLHIPAIWRVSVRRYAAGWARSPSRGMTRTTSCSR